MHEPIASPSESTRWLRVILAAILGATCVASHGTALAGEPGVVCPGATAKILMESRKYPYGSPLQQAAIEVSPGPSVGTRRVTLVGPVFGSMDSPHFKTSLTCVGHGVVVTQTIIRSADFHGAMLKNDLWRPITTLDVTLKSQRAELTAEWEVRLSDGKPFDAAHAAYWEHYSFPVVVTKEIHQ